MSLGDWLLFSSITLVATLSPGPAILLVVSNSVRFGPAACIPGQFSAISPAC